MLGLLGETKEEIWATEAQVLQKLEKVDNGLISLPKGYLPNFVLPFSILCQILKAKMLVEEQYCTTLARC